ncbi:MAG: M23 family metallopeptidase, partial [Firmicutes bacterium]|nr:M23 family metallopeptidase [Bacillota bacterium]
MEKKRLGSRSFAGLRHWWHDLLRSQGRSWARRQVALGSLVLMVVVTVAGVFYLASDWNSGRYLEGEEFYWEAPLVPANPEPVEEEKPTDVPKPTAPTTPSSAAAQVKPAPQEEKLEPTEPVTEVGTADPGPEPEEPLQAVMAPGQAFSALIRPVNAEITSPFGWRKHPVFDDWRFHPGVDMAAPLGSEVKVVLAGTVAEVKEDPVLGRVVVIEHGDKRHSTYAHLEEIMVEVGEPVAQGEVIGTVGQTGVAAEPHLHL